MAAILSLVLITIAGVSWYRGQAKDWNQRAVLANFLRMSLAEERFNPEKREIPDRFFLPDEMSFAYQVRNTTGNAYLIETTDKKYVMTRSENVETVHWVPQQVTLESPAYLPPHSTGQIKLTIRYLDELLEQLDGFVLFDYENDVLITFPRGW